jgi:hypothetical protein
MWKSWAIFSTGKRQAQPDKMPPQDFLDQLAAYASSRYSDGSLGFQRAAADLEEGTSPASLLESVTMEGDTALHVLTARSSWAVLTSSTARTGPSCLSKTPRVTRLALCCEGRTFPDGVSSCYSSFCTHACIVSVTMTFSSEFPISLLNSGKTYPGSENVCSQTDFLNGRIYLSL